MSRINDILYDSFVSAFYFLRFECGKCARVFVFDMNGPFECDANVVMVWING